METIPKIIHYCWFGGKPLPKNAVKCIKSWKKYFPDYEIIRWDESNFDVNSIPYTQQAYKAKKYAFVSDYARFKVLYDHGGVYFDVDVEAIKSFDDILKEGAFMGIEMPLENYNPEDGYGVNPGLGMADFPHTDLYREILELYGKRSFIKENGEYDLSPVGTHVTRILFEKGLKNKAGIQKVDGVTIYPKDYFCPKSIDGTKNFTINTRSIHHYDASWMSPIKKYKIFLSVRYPKAVNFAIRIKGLLKKRKS